MRKSLLALLVLTPIAAGSVFALPSALDRRMNSVATPAPYPASESAKNLHERLFIADLHDDALLWERDLLKRYDFGHSDLPRMLEGHVGLQVFSAVTKTPRGLNNQSNSAEPTTSPCWRWPNAGRGKPGTACSNAHFIKHTSSSRPVPTAGGV